MNPESVHEGHHELYAALIKRNEEFIQAVKEKRSWEELQEVHSRLQAIYKKLLLLREAETRR